MSFTKLRMLHILGAFVYIFGLVPCAIVSYYWIPLPVGGFMLGTWAEERMREARREEPAKEREENSR